MSQPARTRITASEYFQLPEYAQHDLIQLIDGEVVISMPPVLRHQMIVGKILFLLMKLAEDKGGLALTAPTEVQLDASNVYEPDVLYIRPENLSIAEQDEKRLIGAPDLVVEVLSPGTAKIDRQEKYQAYEAHGVGEYWIVDPAYEVVEVWTLDAERRFRRLGAFAGDDAFDSVVLGEPVTVKTFFIT